jgi:hypothetical protein
MIILQQKHQSLITSQLQSSYSSPTTSYLHHSNHSRHDSNGVDDGGGFFSDRVIIRVIKLCDNYQIADARTEVYRCTYYHVDINKSKLDHANCVENETKIQKKVTRRVQTIIRRF